MVASGFDESFKLWKQGAEAKLYTGEYLGKRALVKERFQKNYRHLDLDTAITKERIKNEARAIVRCKTFGVRTPALYLVDFHRRRIYMEHLVNGVTVKEFIIDFVKPECLSGDSCRLECLRKMARKIGTVLGNMHKNNMIHGDLTTSNMLLVPETYVLETSTDEEKLKCFDRSDVVMIDFGLSHIDSSAEDKGVDLYVLERALISTHNDVPDLFDLILESYKKANDRNIKEVIDKFEEVRARGRKRTMVG